MTSWVQALPKKQRRVSPQAQGAFVESTAARESCRDLRHQAATQCLLPAPVPQRMGREDFLQQAASRGRLLSGIINCSLCIFPAATG